LTLGATVVALAVAGPWLEGRADDVRDHENHGGTQTPIKHVIVLIDGAPQGMACTIDGQQDLVEVLRVSWLGASTLQLMRVVLPKLPTPLAHGYMRDVDTACKEELLHVAVAQGEARSEPDARADDLTGDAVVCVALGVSGWRHVGLLLLRLARSVRGHRGGHDVTGWEGWSTT